MKKELTELINSLKNDKTIVIVGNKANSEYLAIEENKELYTRKNMVKFPQKYWKGYKEAFFDKNYDIANHEKAINRLLTNNSIKIEKVINFSYRGNLIKKDNIIDMNGEYNKIRCMQCNKEYVIDASFFDDIESIKKCKSCNGKISPTITMYGEEYKSYLLDAVKESLFDTDENNNPVLKANNLLVIDADFEEKFTDELIESFSALKAKNPKANLIIISKNDSVFINYYNADFATIDDIDSSIERLITLMED